MKLPYYVLYPLMTGGDWLYAQDITRGRLLRPDVTLAPDGEPYLYRWHLVYNNAKANVFFHIQVASDPERPLHDHPWDNSSVILRGGYDEIYEPSPELVPAGADHATSRTAMFRRLREGDKADRAAECAHRLILPPDIPYTMTLFTTGPKVREWGFWCHDGWKHNEPYIKERQNGHSIRTC